MAGACLDKGANREQAPEKEVIHEKEHFPMSHSTYIKSFVSLLCFAALYGSVGAVRAVDHGDAPNLITRSAIFGSPFSSVFFTVLASRVVCLRLWKAWPD